MGLFYIKTGQNKPLCVTSSLKLLKQIHSIKRERKLKKRTNLSQKNGIENKLLFQVQYLNKNSLEQEKKINEFYQ